MAVGPDGAIYFADWVLRDYPVHGRGRIWRLSLPADEIKPPSSPRSNDVAADHGDTASALENARSEDPFRHLRGVVQLDNWRDLSAESLTNARVRLGVLEAEHLHSAGGDESLLRRFLQDNSPEVRLFAVRWISDERMLALRDDVARLLDGPQPSRRYYLAVLGAIDWLDHEPSLRGAEIADELLVRELANNRRLPEIRAMALAMVKPDNKFLTIGRLREYLQAKYLPLRMEAVRSLAQQANPQRFGLLGSMAEDESQTDDLRAEAIVGLSGAAQQNRDLLEKLARSNRAVLRQAAEQSLRLAGLRPVMAEAKPPADDLAAWQSALNSHGDAPAGRRLFFSPVGARCSICHKYDGRGGNIGPDLTALGRTTPREKIIASILRPSQEIAPDYQAWTLVTTDGKTLTGLRMPKPGDNGTEDYVDSAGRLFTLPGASIEQRHASATSIMPDNLQSLLSIADLRDLVTFLTALEVVP
jgi:putative heme-binding domain-containing protein